MNKEHMHLFETNNFTLPVGPATILAVSNNIQTGDFHTSKSTLSKTCFPEMRQVSQPPWSRHSKPVVQRGSAVFHVLRDKPPRQCRRARDLAMSQVSKPHRQTEVAKNVSNRRTEVE